MKLFILLATGIVAAWYWASDGFSNNYASAFSADGTPEVVLVTFEGCNQGCDKARQHLKSRGIIYSEIDARRDMDRWQAIGSPSRMPFLLAGDQYTDGYNPGFFSSVLGQTLGSDGLSSQEQRIYQDHFDGSGERKIVLYGTDWCGYCTRLRKNFADNNVAYDYVNMDKPHKKTWLMQALGIYGYPVVYVGYERVKSPDYSHVMEVAAQ